MKTITLTDHPFIIHQVAKIHRLDDRLKSERRKAPAQARCEVARWLGKRAGRRV